MLITWVHGLLILIENVLWLNLETFMWLNEFLSMIENLLWLEVKTLTRINQKCTWFICFLLAFRGKRMDTIKDSKYLIENVLWLNLVCLIYKVLALDWEFTLVNSENANKLIENLHWLICKSTTIIN